MVYSNTAIAKSLLNEIDKSGETDVNMGRLSGLSANYVYNLRLTGACPNTRALISILQALNIRPSTFFKRLGL